MNLDELRESQNMEDRRGAAFGGYGPHLAVGGGGLGLVGVLLMSFLFGVNPSDLINATGGRYSHLKLESRHGVAALPHVRVIDLRREKDADENAKWLSAPFGSTKAAAAVSG